MVFKEIFSGFRKKTKEEVCEKMEEIINKEETIENGPVITIAREFGSGGREIAMKVSQKLNYDFYDKEKIIETAKKEGIDTSLFE